MGDGNALYFMPDPCVELFGATITQGVTSSKFSAKNDYYDLKIIVCGDYVKVLVDGVERINKTLPAELLEYGRVGLFTANTNGSFSGGVEIYNLDEKGNRIPLDNYVPTTGVEVSQTNVEVTLLDEGVKLGYSVVPATATVKDVRYLSASPDIAVVDNDGYIHPLKAGVTEVLVITKDGGFKNSIIVTVTEIVPELEGITIDKTEVTINKVGEKAYLSASFYPEEAENLGFKWSSSNTKVAIVNNGTVIAMGEGTCVITVKDYYGNFSSTCTVTVGGSGNGGKEEGKKGCKNSFGIDVFGLPLAVGAILSVRRRRED
jgi:hypothetical protein